MRLQKKKIPKTVDFDVGVNAVFWGLFKSSLMIKLIDSHLYIPVFDSVELKDLDEQITTEDLEDIEDALYEAAKERAVDLKKEEREEDLEDCEEVGGSLRGWGVVFEFK